MPGGIHPPLEVIETWPKPNYAHPETKGWGLIIVSIVLGALSVVVVTLRMWCRLVISHNQGIDDYILLAAMIPSVGLAVGICLASEYGFSKHVWDIIPSELPRTRQIVLAIDLLYVWSTGLIRISVLLFYKRLTTGILPRGFIYALWAAIAFVVAFLIVFTVTWACNCQPFSDYWNQVNLQWAATHSFNCIDDPADILAATATGCAQDFITASMPTLVLFRLKIPLKQRIALAAVFALGFFLCVTSVLRLVYIHRVFYTTYDVTWEAWNAWLWTDIEVLAGTIVASAPALKVLFRRFFNTYAEKYFSGSSSRIKYYTGLSRMSLPQRISRRFSSVPWERNEQQQQQQGPREDQRRSQGQLQDPAIGEEGFAVQLEALRESEEHRDEVAPSEIGTAITNDRPEVKTPVSAKSPTWHDDEGRREIYPANSHEGVELDLESGSHVR